MTEEWTPWIDHDGRGMPIPSGIIAQWVLEKAHPRIGIAPNPGYEVRDCGSFAIITGKSYPGPAWDWENFRKINPATGNVIGMVLRYRLRRPRALISLIEMIETLPERQKEDA